MSKSENTTKVECLLHTEDPILTNWSGTSQTGKIYLKVAGLRSLLSGFIQTWKQGLTAL